MLETAIHLARAAGQVARTSLSTLLHVSRKGPRDLVTDVDIAAQRVIVEGLRSRFPGHMIIAEEEALDESGAAEWTWIIDPLDGTTNYTWGLPSFCISIALYHRGLPHLAVVYDPMRDHLFHARRGEGAWLNGWRLRVGERPGLADAMIGYDWARSDAGRRLLVAMIEHLARQAIAVRSMGAAALGLCYVAAGWYDAYFNPELRIWDIAAGAFLVEEAGGVASTWAGDRIAIGARSCLAGNPSVHQALRDVSRNVAGTAM